MLSEGPLTLDARASMDHACPLWLNGSKHALFYFEAVAEACGTAEPVAVGAGTGGVAAIQYESCFSLVLIRM